MKYWLKRIPLNSQGYDPAGRYFGIGQPLYLYMDTEFGLGDHIRAWDREHAKELIKKKDPKAEFFK